MGEETPIKNMETINAQFTGPEWIGIEGRDLFTSFSVVYSKPQQVWDWENPDGEVFFQYSEVAWISPWDPWTS